MSQKYRQQFVDPLGGIIFDAVGNRIFAAAPAAPTSSIAGYLPGCLYEDTLNAVFYYNSGTLASSTWTALTGASAAILAANNTWTGTDTFTGGLTVTTANVTVTDVNFVLSTVTGTQIGTGATQKLGFFGATPIVQPANTVDYVTMLTNLGLRATGGTAAASFPGAVTSNSPTAGVGYATGAGGVITQSTNRTTGVTLNKITGQITTNNASLAAAAKAAFTVTNSTVAATDAVVATVTSGGTGTPRVDVIGVSAGAFILQLTNDHASTADTSADVINFAVIKGVAA